MPIVNGMSRTAGASNTHKTIMLALAEGWRLRCAGQHGWCLFQQGRQRPFAHIGESTVKRMTGKGLLTREFMSSEFGDRPEKILTPLGLRCARRLIETRWAESMDWDSGPIAGRIDPTSTTPSRRPSPDTFGLQPWGISA